MRIANRAVSLFRCQIDPMIATKPRLAHMLSDPDLIAMRAQAKVSDDGKAICVLLVKNGNPELHMVGLPNVQAAKLQLTPDEIKALKLNLSFETLEAFEDKPIKIAKVKSQAV